jgi:hypothetical protein
MKFQWQTSIIVSHQPVKFFAPPIRGFGEIWVGILKIPPNVTFFSICSIPDIFVKHIEYNLIFNSAKFFKIGSLVCEISRVKLCKKVVFFALLMTRCTLDFQPGNTAIYAMCSVSNDQTYGQFSFGWLQYYGSYDGSK